MQKETELLSKVFILAIAAIALFKMCQLSFWLMSTRSTILNIGGLVLLVLVISCLSIIIIKKTKKK